MADQLSLVISLALLSIEETERAGSLLQRAVSGARERSAIGLLPFRLGRLAWVHYWDGRWSAARGCVHEALQLAESTGWVNERPSSLATLARLEAVTGKAGRVPSPRRRGGRGRRADGRSPLRGVRPGGFGAVGTEPRPLLERDRVLCGDGRLRQRERNRRHAGAVVVGSTIEAYVRYGLPDEARRVLARLEQSVASNPRLGSRCCRTQPSATRAQERGRAPRTGSRLARQGPDAVRTGPEPV